MLSFSFLMALLNGFVDSRQPFPFIGLMSRLSVEMSWIRQYIKLSLFINKKNRTNPAFLFAISY
jgi:hypothetical protein